MPTPTKRSALEVLHRERLAALARRFEIELRASASKAKIVDALARSRVASFPAIVGVLLRGELAEICRRHGLAVRGRKGALAARVLGQELAATQPAPKVMPAGPQLGFSTDGYTEEEARARPDFDELVECEACGRYFENDPRLWVGWSGASITCVHCFMGMNAGIVLDGTVDGDEAADLIEFVEEKEDESTDPIGGLAGYRQRFRPGHDRKRCPFGSLCVLCSDVDWPSSA
ncbi:MAG: hypothetical protein KC636_18185 [Myxococcales bacterium]|nr:hypothetical protein [Myxococcales bacterium]